MSTVTSYLIGGGVCEPGGQLASLLLDEVPDGHYAPARLLGDDLGGVLLLHYAVVDPVLLGLVEGTENVGIGRCTDKNKLTRPIHFYEHARSEHARQWEPFHVRACVSFCSWGPLGTVRHFQHRVLRPLISNLRSDTTSEVIWRPPWPQRPTNWWLEATCT